MATDGFLDAYDDMVALRRQRDLQEQHLGRLAQMWLDAGGADGSTSAEGGVAAALLNEMQFQREVVRVADARYTDGRHVWDLITRPRTVVLTGVAPYDSEGRYLEPEQVVA